MFQFRLCAVNKPVCFQPVRPPVRACVPAAEFSDRIAVECSGLMLTVTDMLGFGVGVSK